jgi:ribosome-associated protein|tara:strand:+ start:1129 stop:1353 length:225 start_codon:yes stop_codon:yes gene_type:complete
MTNEQFGLKTEFIDLLQLLKATGHAATGGEAKMMVQDGLIKVNGELESRKRRKLRLGDEVNIDDQVLILLEASA